MDFDLNDDDESHEAELVPMPDMAQLAAAAHGGTLSRPNTLRAIEDDIFEKATAVVQDITCAREIDPDATEPPASWVRALGSEEAQKRFRVARAAWEPTSKAPAFLGFSVKTSVGIAKARATLGQGPKELNLQVQFIHAPMANYETKKVGGR